MTNSRPHWSCFVRLNNCRSSVVWFLSLCLAISWFGNASAYTIDGTTTILLSTSNNVPNDHNSSVVQIIGTPPPTKMYYAFNFEDKAGVYFHGSVSTNIQSVCNGSSTSGCGGPTTGALHSGGFTYARISGTLQTYETTTASITISFGGAPPWIPRPNNDDSPLSEWLRWGSGARNPPPPRIKTGQSGVRGLIDGDYSVPVVDENGFSDYIWANAATPTAYPSSTEWNPIYLFASNDPFTHFLVPDSFPGGDNEFQIIIDEHDPITMQAGTPIDFTTYYPEGITAFVLTGIDANEGLVPDTIFPFLHGFRFAEEGTARVGYGTLSPGDYTLDGLVNDDDLAIWQESYGVDDGGDADGDGDTDGRDFLIWQRNYFPGEASAASTVIPEPATIFLLAQAIFFAYQRRQSQASKSTSPDNF